ncbi:hypothetical protein B0H14DRAFT_345466 [Mycena olivaceomarginata]|nr:hypothetical protein B0H14DRAFT_345466 [Mycena olivaceomarginata]
MSTQNQFRNPARRRRRKSRRSRTAMKTKGMAKQLQPASVSTFRTSSRVPTMTRLLLRSMRPLNPSLLQAQPQEKSQPVGTAETAIKARSKLKKKVVSDDDGNNSLGQSDGEEDEQSDAQSQSEPEDAPVLDIELEGAQIIELQHQSVAPGPKEFFQSDDDDQPKPRHRRQASSSSVGSMPPDTDFDFDLEERHENDEDDEDNKNDEAERDEEEEEEEEEVEVPVKPKMSAQQLKYEDEKPAIRSSKVIQSSQVKKAKADPTAESDWHPTARIVFPATGGNIKLLDQNGTLKAVTRLVIDLHLYEIAFKAGYEGTVSRSAASRRLIRKSAKKRPDGSHIGERARRDLGFCAHLAPIVCGVLSFPSSLTLLLTDLRARGQRPDRSSQQRDLEGRHAL